MVGIIISIVLLIAGAYMTLDGYNSMNAIWRDSNEGLLFIGIIVLVLGIVILLVSLVNLLKSKNQAVSTGTVKYCGVCRKVLKENEVYCHKCGAKQNK